jgi:MFS family permease
MEFFSRRNTMKDSKLSAFQKWIIALIGIITVINFVDRSAISFVIQPLEREFGLTKLEFGAIAAAFGIGYSISTFLGGILVDRFGTVGTWALSAFLWSIATMMLAMGKGYYSFFCLRVFLGIAEGLHFPALVRTVTDWIPARWHARAAALGLFGIPFASIIGAPLVTYLISQLSWRSMFVILGFLGIVWAVLWLVLFRKHPHALFSSMSTRKGGFSFKNTPWKSIFINPTFTTSCIIYFAYGYTMFFVLMWAPGYLVQVHKLSIQSTGLVLVPPWICAAIFMLIGGWLSDYLWKKTNSLRLARSSLIGTGLLISGLCMIPIMFSQGVIWDLAWLSLSLGFAASMHPPIYTLNADLFGPFAGMAQGVLSCYFALSGIAAPTITGWVVQTTGSFHYAFLVVSVLSISTSLMILLFQKPDTQPKLV